MKRSRVILISAIVVGISIVSGFIFFLNSEPPKVETDNYENITTDSANLKAFLSDLGTSNKVNARFNYRKSGEDSWKKSDIMFLENSEEFSDTIEGLDSDTKYQFRAYAEGDGNDTGEILSFTTDKVKQTLEISVSGEGTTDPEEGEYTYKKGEKVEVTANPAKGWKFDEWTGSYSSDEKTIKIEMDNDKFIKANFEEVSGPKIEIDLSEDTTIVQTTEKQTISYKIHNVVHEGEYDIHIYERLFGPQGEQIWKDTYDIGRDSGHTTAEFLDYSPSFTPNSNYEPGSYTLKITIEDKISGKKSSKTAEIGIERYTLKNDESIEETKSKAIEVDYDDFFRNIEKYKEDVVHFKGEVVQVLPVEGWDNLYQLHVFTKLKNNVYADNDLYSYYQGPPRLLKNDIIDFWGQPIGSKRYQTVEGDWRTIPKLRVLYVELSGNSEGEEKGNPFDTFFSFATEVNGLDDYQPRSDTYYCPNDNLLLYHEVSGLKVENSAVNILAKMEITGPNGEIVRDKTLIDSKFEENETLWFEHNITAPSEGWEEGTHKVKITVTDKIADRSVNHTDTFYHVYREPSCQ